MKLTLTLEATRDGMRAGLVEEWDEPGGVARMEPMIRVFDDRDAAMSWGRAMARRRGLKQLYLNEGRSPAAGSAP